VCALILGSFITQADAALFDWSYTSSLAPPIVAGGTLTTGAADAGGFDIIGITGTFNTLTITGLLAPGTCCLAPPNDNILFFPGTPFLSLGGLGFTDTNNDQVNLYFGGARGAPDTYHANLGNRFLGDGDFEVNAVPSVPGPIAGAGLPGLIFASGGLLGWWRRRQKYLTLTTPRIAS